MSDKTEATEMVLNKIDEYMNAAKTVIETYGGDVADLGLLALRVEAGSEILLPLFSSMVLGFASYKGMRHFLTNSRSLVDVIEKGWSARSSREDKIVKMYTGSNQTDAVPEDKIVEFSDKTLPLNWESPLPIISISIGAISMCCLMGALNLWAWVGLFYPEAYAVHLFLLK